MNAAPSAIERPARRSAFGLFVTRRVHGLGTFPVRDGRFARAEGKFRRARRKDARFEVDAALTGLLNRPARNERFVGREGPGRRARIYDERRRVVQRPKGVLKRERFHGSVQMQSGGRKFDHGIVRGFDAARNHALKAASGNREDGTLLKAQVAFGTDIKRAYGLLDRSARFGVAERNTSRTGREELRNGALVLKIPKRPRGGEDELAPVRDDRPRDRAETVRKTHGPVGRKEVDGRILEEGDLHVVGSGVGTQHRILLEVRACDVLAEPGALAVGDEFERAFEVGGMGRSVFFQDLDRVVARRDEIARFVDDVGVFRPEDARNATDLSLAFDYENEAVRRIAFRLPKGLDEIERFARA